ncbi:MAG: site-2 protease family protein [Bifidobacteriaceae bacterium]|nr:site-2 protease family protein [Bifidobacteriaceae bacterium]
MNVKGLRIARIKGAPVVVTWSWLVVALLVAATFVDGFAEDRSVQIVSAVGAVVILFATVLVHELAHGWAARAVGIGVREYALTFFGGETTFTAPMPTPGKAAVTSASGPVANLVLGALAWFAFRAGSDNGVFPAYAAGDMAARIYVHTMTLTYMVAFLNIAVGVFNLIPALPLDGGVLVQALVWRVTGRRERGMVAAGWCGLVIGIAMVALGLLETRRRLTSTIWLILIGATVAQGAWASIRRGRAISRAAGKTVRAHLEPAVAVPSHTPVADIASELDAHTWVVVMDRAVPVGYVDREAARTVPATSADTTPVDGVMVALPVGVAVPVDLAGVDLVRAIAPYAAAVRVLPVVDAGHLAGVLPLAPVVAGF